MYKLYNKSTTSRIVELQQYQSILVRVSRDAAEMFRGGSVCTAAAGIGRIPASKLERLESSELRASDFPLTRRHHATTCIDWRAGDTFRPRRAKISRSICVITSSWICPPPDKTGMGKDLKDVGLTSWTKQRK